MARPSMSNISSVKTISGVTTTERLVFFSRSKDRHENNQRPGGHVASHPQSLWLTDALVEHGFMLEAFKRCNCIEHYSATMVYSKRAHTSLLLRVLYTTDRAPDDLPCCPRRRSHHTSIRRWSAPAARRRWYSYTLHPRLQTAIPIGVCNSPRS